MLHVSASCRKLLELAEEMELKKRDQAGLMREFLFVHLRDFLAPDQLPEDLLTTAEKQFIVRHELDNIRALSEDPSIPGYPNFRMYEGQSIGKSPVLIIIDFIYPMRRIFTVCCYYRLSVHGFHSDSTFLFIIFSPSDDAPRSDHRHVPAARPGDPQEALYQVVLLQGAAHR